jgi:hypothetical protein
MFTSNQAFRYDQEEKQLGIAPNDSVVIEFDGQILGPSFPWEAQETVGIGSTIRLQRGSCPKESKLERP